MFSAVRTVKLAILSGLCLLLVGVNVAHFLSRAGMDPVRATVSTVDRSCEFVSKASGDKKTDYCGDSASLTSDPNLFKNGKRVASVKGSAKVVFVYTAPDGSSQSGSGTIPARKNMFYSLKAGDELPIFVDREDPTKFILD